MATTSPVSAAEREELITDYVENSAMSWVLHVLIGNVANDDSPYAASVYGPPWKDLIVHETDPALYGAAHRLEQLWPEDEDIEGAEYRAAERRADLLASQLLAAIVANPDYLSRRAAWLLEGVTAAMESRGGNDDA